MFVSRSVNSLKLCVCIVHVCIHVVVIIILLIQYSIWNSVQQNHPYGASLNFPGQAKET